MISAAIEMLSTPGELLEWIARMRREGGKPVGVKITVGGPGFADELASQFLADCEGARELDREAEARVGVEVTHDR